MSRTIKFRAWDKEAKSYVGDTQLGFTLYEIALSPFEHADKLKDLDFEQYTGLKDKNGKEIYEGDIVKVGSLKPTFKVEYSEPCTKFWMKCKGGLVEEFEDWDEEKEVEVIGNIHENPELLGGGE